MDQLDFYDLMEEDQHDPQIQYQLGLCYLYGYGIEIDENKAEYWFRLAAEQGHSEAKKILREEDQGEQDQTLTADNLPMWCNKAEEGDPDAQYAIACYFAGLDENKYREDIFHYLKQAAQQGHGYACWELGKRMALAKEYKKAVVYLEQATECQISEAAQLLSYCYNHGHGVSRNIDISERILERDAELGDGFAKLRLAVRYEVGEGVRINYVKAMAWLERARQAGLADAQALFDQQVAAYRAEEARLRREKAAAAVRLWQEKAAEEARLRQEKAAEEARLQQEKAAEEARLQEEKRLQEAQKWQEEQARLAKERWEQVQRKKKWLRRLASLCGLCLLAAATYVYLTYQPPVTYTWNFDQSFQPLERPNDYFSNNNVELFSLGERNVAVFTENSSLLSDTLPFETKEDLTFTVDFYYTKTDGSSTLVLMRPLTVTLDEGNLQISCELLTRNNIPPVLLEMRINGIQSEKWHTLTVTLSRKKQASVYLNGSKVAETEWTEKSRNLSKPYGTSMLLGDDRFCGAVANISISNFPLSESEIKADAAKRLEKLNELDNSLLTPYLQRGSAFAWNGHLYKILQMDMTWEQAQQYCDSIGGHLATISSQEEHDMLYQLLQSSDQYYAYFGLSDSEEEGNWKWVTGEPISFTNWDSGEPNNYNGNEDYAIFSREFDESTWNDVDCSYSAFICEWDEE